MKSLKVIRNTVAGMKTVRVGEVITPSPRDARVLLGYGLAEEYQEAKPAAVSEKPKSKKDK